MGGSINPHQCQLVTDKEVAALLKISKSGVWSKASSDPEFPKPFKLAPKQTRWLLSEVYNFISLKKGLEPQLMH